MNIFDATKSVPADLRAILEDVKVALDGREVADRAAIANRDAIAAGGIRIVELEAASAVRDAEAVRAEARAAADADLKAEAVKAVKAADKANTELSDVRRAHERRIAAVEVLSADARAIDATIDDLKKRLTAAIAGYRKQILAALNEDLLEACAPLIPVIQAAMTINGQIPDGGLARDWLDCAKLISPVDYRAEHDHFSHHVRVRGTDLLASQDPLPALPIGAMTVLQELAAVSAALKRHQPFTIPKLPRPQAETPQRSPSEQRRYDEGAERIRRSEEEFDQRAERAKQPQTPEERRIGVLTFGNPVRRSRLHAVAPKNSARDRTTKVWATSMHG